MQSIEEEQNTQYEAFVKYVLVNHNAYILMIPSERIHSHSLHLMNWKENEMKVWMVCSLLCLLTGSTCSVISCQIKKTPKLRLACLWLDIYIKLTWQSRLPTKVAAFFRRYLKIWVGFSKGKYYHGVHNYGCVSWDCNNWNVFDRVKSLTRCSLWPCVVFDQQASKHINARKMLIDILTLYITNTMHFCVPSPHFSCSEA